MSAPLPSLETLRAAEPVLRLVLEDTLATYLSVLEQRGVRKADLLAARDAALERLRVRLSEARP
jgi:hypothetical protein